MRGMQEELVVPIFGSPKDYVHRCLSASRPPPHAPSSPPSTISKWLPILCLWRKAADSDGRANALTACGSVVGFGQMSKGKD